ncbi:MAG: pyruvate formate lyase family protein [Proteobacteria bacterium]|nr:pyruvate formate lyase family protein [Pseudomonadota bacterium]
MTPLDKKAMNPGNDSLNDKRKNTASRFMAHGFLTLMAIMFSKRSSLNAYLKSKDGWLDFTIGFITKTSGFCRALCCMNGKVTVIGFIPENTDTILYFKDDPTLFSMFRMKPNNIANMISTNRIILEGNVICFQLFIYLCSILCKKNRLKCDKKAYVIDLPSQKNKRGLKTPLFTPPPERMIFRINGPGKGPEIIHLSDPFLSMFNIDDFQRLKTFKDQYQCMRPVICCERAKLLTDWLRENRFTNDAQDRPWDIELKKANAFYHIMAYKKALIRKNDLIAGTSSLNEIIGTIVYPETMDILVWGELGHMGKSPFIPLTISKETIHKLHHDIFPFWRSCHPRTWAKTPNNDQIQNHWKPFNTKTPSGISQAIPDIQSILDKGTYKIMDEINKTLKDPGLDGRGRAKLKARFIYLEGFNAYADNLARSAIRMVKGEDVFERQAELLRLAEICQTVPMNPAKTLDEAVHVLNLTWVGMSMGNTHWDFSLGRLDQYLQPYFLKDMADLTNDKDKIKYIRQTLDLIGCLILRLSDHVPLCLEWGNTLFNAPSSLPVITRSNMPGTHESSANDMTCIIIKVKNMLGLNGMTIQDKDGAGQLIPGAYTPVKEKPHAVRYSQ